jgi:hypothetical protein
VTSAPVIPQEAGKAITSTSTITSTIEEFEERGIPCPVVLVLVLVLVLVFLSLFRLPPFNDRGRARLKNFNRGGITPPRSCSSSFSFSFSSFCPLFACLPSKIEDEHDNEHD